MTETFFFLNHAIVDSNLILKCEMKWVPLRNQVLRLPRSSPPRALPPESSSVQKCVGLHVPSLPTSSQAPLSFSGICWEPTMHSEGSVLQSTARMESYPAAPFP